MPGTTISLLRAIFGRALEKSAAGKESSPYLSVSFLQVRRPLLPLPGDLQASVGPVVPIWREEIREPARLPKCGLRNAVPRPNAAVLARTPPCRQSSGSTDPDDHDLPDKPKWMRWSTYERLADRHDAANENLDQQALIALNRLLKVWGWPRDRYSRAQSMRLDLSASLEGNFFASPLEPI